MKCMHPKTIKTNRLNNGGDNMKKITLRTKLILGGVVAAILPLVVVGLFAINKSSSALVSIAQ